MHRESKEIVLLPAHIEPAEVHKTVDLFTAQLAGYLDSLGLPSKNVLVVPAERRRVILNLPDAIELIGPGERTNANYISKFVAAVAAGLFDAALNFLWNETVANLRLKVARFDLDYFYDSVITDPDRRKKVQTAEDLTDLDDWELIRGCHLTGVLSEIGFRHLDYVRGMRNWASAAHPNQNELTGLQLVAWLETCVKEVIAKEPEGPVIHVKTLLHNVRTKVLTAADCKPIISNIEMLPPDLAVSLIRTLFGMYTDPKMAATAKNNIKLLSPAVWKQAPEAARYEVGLKYQTFASNADIPRRDAAKEFLDGVGGLSYLPPTQFAVELDEQVRNLYHAHLGWDNFYNEPPYARTLVRYVPATGVIPDSARSIYVKTVMMARIGKGSGIARSALPYYEELLNRFQDSEIREVPLLLRDTEFTSRLQFDSCAVQYRNLCTAFLEKTTNPFVQRALDKIISSSTAQIRNLEKDSGMQRLLKDLD